MHSSARTSLHELSRIDFEQRLNTLNLIYRRADGLLDVRSGRLVSVAALRDRLSRYTNWTFIFLAPRSSIVMRKLRIWPARTASDFASVGEGPLFQRAASIELKEDRSAAPVCDCSFAAVSNTRRARA